jgi:SAM-dependent methyltransferase
MSAREHGWWEDERATFIRERVRPATAPGTLIADVGCGRGGLLGGADLGGTVVNIDSHLWDIWKVSPRVLYVCASATELPFRAGAFDVVGSFDVLEHLPEDGTAIREQRRVLSDSGRLVAAVPADTRLWSAHDEAVGHVRRYDTASIAELTAASGLTVRRSTYFFSFLWLPALLTRKLSARAEPGNEAGLMSRIVRRGVGVASALERWVLRRRRLPFGTSLWFECETSDAAPHHRP